MIEATGFPTWPPGLWRRIILQPGERWIGVALEDDMHCFVLRIGHEEGRIVSVAGKALRHPWSACPGAVDYLKAQLAGKRLEDVAGLEPRENCTHLLDLAILGAAHVTDEAPRRFDMKVADRVEGRTTAILYEDGIERLRWQLDGLDVAGPQGRNLRALSQWKRELPPEEAEWATLLRRAVFVSGGRQFNPPAAERAADQGPARMGVCYNYQLPQAARSTRTPDWRQDFSLTGREPLQGLQPAEAFTALKEQA